MSVSEIQEIPSSKDLLSAIFDDPNFQRFIKISEEQISSICWSFSVVSICVDIYQDKACAEIRLKNLEGLQPRLKSLCNQRLRKVVSQNMRDYY